MLKHFIEIGFVCYCSKSSQVFSFFFFLYSLIHPDSSNTSLSTRLVSVQEDAGKSPARNRYTPKWKHYILCGFPSFHSNEKKEQIKMGRIDCYTLF